MNIMAKEYLEQVRNINVKLKSMARQVDLLRDALMDVTQTLSDMPHSGTRDIHRMDGLIASKVDLENEIADETAKLADINLTINKLPDNYRVLIINRYFFKASWKQIASELYVSESRIYQLHREALNEIDTVLKNRQKDYS